MTCTSSKSKSLRALTFLGVVLFCFHWSFSQREPQYTQYMYNIGSFNPAYVGTVESMDISALYRAQWIDIDGAPRTIRVGTNIPFANKRNGMGFNVVNDQLGPTTSTYVDISYSYQLNISENTRLSFGIDAGGSFLNVDFSKGDFENPGEPILDRGTINEFYPIIGAGLFLYADNWYLGASAPNFLTDGIYNDEVAAIVDDKLQFNLIGGYVFDLSSNLKFKPAVLVNLISGAPATINGSANFLISDVFTVGASYRVDNAVSGLVGFQISNGLFAGYSYDYNTNPLGDYNNGSHEVILKFYIGRGSGQNGNKNDNLKGKPKQIDSPRFF
ncbi:PorP/SprF family type IX secretion system membrane protein [Eudoraea chungangensis]|uniref:PorP/SprF family type IX secretion system membrane protein n=1 Tax=Eudoraea chungangensis TaxID=1481905 RepID=UPI0023EAC60E|nr:type IX secretion system membrane protein PorP/SprF [Eudoraea chungangensis]